MTPGLALTEAFTTLQGEGPSAGRPATFVRFGGCNLSCSWCDSKFTWDSTRYDLRVEITRWPVDRALSACHAPIVVLTGGEPLLHQKTPAFVEFITALADAGKAIHVETNGTIAPSDLLQRCLSLAVVSPKQAHAMADQRTGVDPFVPEVLEVFAALAREGRSIAKYVVQTREDCDLAVAQARAVGFPNSTIWLMPEGENVDLLQTRWQMVCEAALDHGVNATHRLHVLAWGEERGH